MKLSINLALLLTSTLVVASSGEAPHKHDRSSVSSTRDKKDLLTAPMMGGGGRRVPCGRGRPQPVEGGRGGGGWLERFGLWTNTPAAHVAPVGDEGTRRVPLDLIFVIPVEQLAHGQTREVVEAHAEHAMPGMHAVHPHHPHHHRHAGFRPHGGRTLADRLDRAIGQLEPIEAGVLSFVFGFGFMSLFGMLFAITRRLVLRKRACRARRAARAEQAVAPPAYVAALAAEEKVALLVEPATAQEQQQQ